MSTPRLSIPLNAETLTGSAEEVRIASHSCARLDSLQAPVPKQVASAGTEFCSSNAPSCPQHSTFIALASEQVAGATPFPPASNLGHGSCSLDRSAVRQNVVLQNVSSPSDRAKARVESKPNLLKRAAPSEAQASTSKVRVVNDPEETRGSKNERLVDLPPMEFPKLGQPWDIKLDPNLDVIKKIRRSQ